MAQQPNPKLTRRLLILTLAFGPILILWGSLTVSEGVDTPACFSTPSETASTPKNSR